MSELKNRIDFVYLIDVQDGNPNGDPDAGNLPRVDAETGMGIITDVCLKRKVRNYIQITKLNIKGFDILIKSKELSGLNTFIDTEISDVYNELSIDLTKDKDLESKKRKKKGTAQGIEVDKGRAAMCAKFYDVRTFGAVLSTGPNAGQVRGPIQLTFARSVDPIFVIDRALTVCAARNTEKDFESQIGIQGHKATVPYGLYVCHGFITPSFAKATGFDEDDLELFWEALKNMFECDHSAARGLMSARKLYAFKHQSALGNASAVSLFERINIARKDPNSPARSFNDYEISVNTEGLAEGVELLEII